MLSRLYLYNTRCISCFSRKEYKFLHTWSHWLAKAQQRCWWRIVSIIESACVCISEHWAESRLEVHWLGGGWYIFHHLHIVFLRVLYTVHALETLCMGYYNYFIRAFFLFFSFLFFSFPSTGFLGLVSQGNMVCHMFHKHLYVSRNIISYNHVIGPSPTNQVCRFCSTYFYFLFFGFVDHLIN